MDQFVNILLKTAVCAFLIFSPSSVRESSTVFTKGNAAGIFKFIALPEFLLIIAVPETVPSSPGDSGLALKSTSTPSVLALSRQSVPTLRIEKENINLTSKGAYIIHGDSNNRDITFLSSGSELSVALEAAKELEKDGISVVVVSMPCWELFEAQTSEYVQNILGVKPKIAIEASISFGWEKWLSKNDIFIGMKSFGASAPANELYKFFKITKEEIINKSKTLLK